MAGDTNDQHEALWRWLSNSEDTVFIQDGLYNLKDLLLIPSDELLMCDDSVDVFQKSRVDEKNLLEKQIKDGIHKTYFNAHEILLTYKIQALKNILKARQTLKKTINDKKTIEKRKTTRQDGGGGVEDMHKSSELTLIMLFPLIESVAKSDPGLCSRIAQLLVDYFKKCNPMSIKGPNVQLDEIETLLIKWTCEKDANNDPFAIEALVALACARDSIDTMIMTVHVLFNMENTSDVESKTKNLLMRVQKLDYEQPQVFDVSRHEFGFHYNSRKKSCLNENKGCDCKELVKRSIALVEDEGYVIVSNDSGCQMAKIGTGYNDTIRGHIYAKSKCLEPGVSIEINGTLIHRPFGLDESNHDTFGYVLNPVTLERKDRISLPTNCAVKWSGVKSISILKYRNNGILWLRQVPADMETLNYLPQAAYISIIDYVNVSQDGAITFEERKILLKNPEPIETTFNILELLKKPKSKKESTVAGGGGDQQHCVKFPTDSHSSSSGLRLATLQESAIICDDAFLTVLAPNPENSRGGGKMAKIIGTSYSFDLENAVLHSQSEMICDHSNAPLSLPKGYSMSNSTSIIYVPNTHKFWSLAYNRIDEFHGNPSSLRKTYLHRRLCNHQMISRQDYEKNGIAYNLLEHVAIQMLRSSDKIILKTHSVQSLIDIASRNITKQSPLILEMLKKIANFDDTDCETLQPLLLRLLHSCDVYVAEMIIKFMLEHSSSKSVTQKIKCILKNPDDSTTTMAIPVKSILRKYYLQETIDNMDFKTEPSVELLEEIDAEFKASIQETLACIKANDVYQLKISQHVSTLVNIISERVLDNEKNTFFTTLCHKAISHQKNLMEKIFNIEKKPEKNSLDAILSMSILGPTFVGTLVCAIMQHESDDDDVTENLLKSFQELFILISKFVNCTQEQEFPNLERGDHLENNLPWIFNRHIFTPHPIKEGYKFQETIKLPGVRCLYLIFDERSSTMSNEDKLTVYSGGSVGNSKKLLEFSGNSRTSKRIGQKHWPKKPILLMGDTVTFDFEVKGRQDTNHDPLLHNLNWGFECFLFHSNDLFDSVNVNTLQNALVTIGPILKEQIFYQFLGSSCSDQENICSHMLSAKILQKCHWNQSNVEHLLHFYENCNFNHEQMIPTIPSKTMSQLRALSGIALPIMRESTKSLSFSCNFKVSFTVRQITHSLKETIDSYMQDQDPDTPDGCLLSDIMMDVYIRIASLIRKLQNFAELESKWANEVMNIKENMVSLKEVFFSDYLHHELRAKDLNLLMFMKNVKEENPNRAVEELKSILEKEALLENSRAADTNVSSSSSSAGIESGKLLLPMTVKLTKAIFGRLDLLLKADTDCSSTGGGGHHLSHPNACSGNVMSMSLQNWPQTKSLKRQQSSELEKSLDDSILQINKLHRSISRLKQSRSIIESSNTMSMLATSPLDLHSNPEIVVNDLFDFIGSNPETSVSPSDFLKAIKRRITRCHARKHSLERMRLILQAIQNIPMISNYMICSFSQCLSLGLRFDDLVCSQKLTTPVMDAYMLTVAKLVDLADCGSSTAEVRMPAEKSLVILGFLSLAPYKRIEAKCLASCGLINLLDKLTDNQDSGGGGHQDTTTTTTTNHQSIRSFAWTCFKLLSKRIVDWDGGNGKETTSSQKFDGSHSIAELNDLEKQISRLITNHLNQATLCGHNSYRFEAVYECLELLKNLASSKIGMGTLSQPGCLSNLFQILMDPYLSPQALQTVLALIQMTIPFIPATEIEKINILDNESRKGSGDFCNNKLNIMRIILDRLAHFIFPTQSSRNQQHMIGKNTHNLNTVLPDAGHGQQIDEVPALEAVFLHKRGDQTTQELIQKLVNASPEIGIFASTDSMDKIIKIDKDISEHGYAEVQVGDATRALRTAQKMAHLGFVVSISTPKSGGSIIGDRAIQICHQRNSTMAQNSPSVPFISSNVANKLSAEIIILVHRLISGIEGDRWLEATGQCIFESFAYLPELLDIARDLGRNELNLETAPRLFQNGKNIIASLALLGGFHETLKPGSAVTLNNNKKKASVGEEEEHDNDGKLDVFSDSTTLKSIKKDGSFASTIIANYDLTQEQVDLTVPLRKLKLEDNILEKSQRLLTKVAQDLVPYLQSFLLPTDDGTEPLCYPLPINSFKVQINTLARLTSEIRTRSCHMLALHMKEEQFARKFLERSCQSVDMLKYFSKDIQPSDKLCCTEFICSNLRGRIKDQIRQGSDSTLDPTSTTSTQSFVRKDETRNHWNTGQVFPPIKNVLFMHNLTGLTYLGSPVTYIGLPRGCLIQSVLPLPLRSETVYFVIHILSLGEADLNDVAGAPTISVGLSPPNVRKEGAWNHAEGAVILHSNGRIVHYQGSNLLLWNSTRVDHLLSPGDVVKVLWIPLTESIGQVQFQVNGLPLGNMIENIPHGLLPTVHIQQKGVRIKTNFLDNTTNGSNNATNINQSTQDTIDQSSEKENHSILDLGGHRRQLPRLCRQAIRMKPTTVTGDQGSGYAEANSKFKLELNGYSRLSTGVKPLLLQDTDWVDEEEDDDDDDDYDDMVDERDDDINTLLVKSWEEKVFPSIRRRFRNESERRDGLDQIKGALSLGMIDIAKQTVEFLYEENGGIPSDLKLPDLDDVKKDMLSLSVDKLRPRMIVSINEQDLLPLPMFACKEQVKTFGLEGKIITVDKLNELVEVETYLEADGIIVRFWYPLDALTKCNNESSHSSQSKLKSMSHLQSQLLNTEFILSRLYCREAFLGLLKWANDDNFILVSSDESNIELNATLMSNVLLLQEFDVENLLYLLDSLTMICHCSIVEQGCDVSGVSSGLEEMSPSLQVRLLNSNYEHCLSAMNEIFIKLSSNNAGLMQELGLEILNSFREFDVKILQECVDINECSILASTITFSNASCVVASLKFGSVNAKPADSMKVVIQPMEFELKSKIHQHSSNYLVNYPCVVKGGKNMITRAFPSVIFSANMMRIYHGGANETNVSLQLDGIPNRLLLALLFIDMLVGWSEQTRTFCFPTKFFFDATEGLSNMVLKFPTLNPTIKMSLLYSIAKLIESLATVHPSTNLEFKITERLFESLVQEFSRLSDCEGTILHSFYLQSLTELCYQYMSFLQRRRGALLQDIPPKLNYLCHAISILKYMKSNSELPSKEAAVKSVMAANETNNGLDKSNATRYLVVMGLPKLLAPHEICHMLKKSLVTLNGLQITEVFCPIAEPEPGNRDSSTGKGNEIEIEASAASSLSNAGCAVVQIQTKIMQSEAKELILGIPSLHQKSRVDVHVETGTVLPLVVSKVLSDLDCEEKSCQPIWLEYVKSKLLNSQQLLNAKVVDVLKKIIIASLRDSSKDYLKFSDLLMKKQNSFLAFLNGTKGRAVTDIRDDLREIFQSKKNETETLKITEIISMVEDQAQDDILKVLKGFIACGYDLDMKSMGNLALSLENNGLATWQMDEDLALISYINTWCSRFHQKYQNFSPSEFCSCMFTFSVKDIEVLKDKTEEEIRSRLCLIKGLNCLVCSYIAPMVNFDSKQGLSKELSQFKSFLLTTWKVDMLRSILNATTEKSDDEPPIITITLDPIANMHKGTDDIATTWFYQSFVIVTQNPSSSLCISSPTSEDPQFPLLIKLSGEDVQGNSGSFRHFLNRIIVELHSTSIPILMPYMGNGSLKGMFILRPAAAGGSSSHQQQILTQKFLEYFGQIIGMAVRSRIPLPLGIAPIFWKCLANESITDQDVIHVDPDLEVYLNELETASSNPEVFEAFLEHHQYPAFAHHSITGEEAELCPGGKNMALTYENCMDYVKKMRRFRRREIVCKDQIASIVTGLSTILPWRFIEGFFTGDELQALVCGAEDTDLHILKKHTIYQVGLSEDDRHIQDFWQILFSLNSKQKKMFIKFACNQERIPLPDYGEDLPPPFPMKIAPADSRDETQDNLLIRAETCIFMLKIPRYSTYDVMKEKLIYSIFSADDPLSG